MLRYRVGTRRSDVAKPERTANGIPAILGQDGLLLLSLSLGSSNDRKKYGQSVLYTSIVECVRILYYYPRLY